MPEKFQWKPSRKKGVEPLDSALPLSKVGKEGDLPENPENGLIKRIDAQRFVRFLQEHLNERQLAILVGHIVEGKKFDELGKEFDVGGTRAGQIFRQAVDIAKRDFKTKRGYEVTSPRPKEIVYETFEDEIDDDVSGRKKEIGREQLDELARLLLGEDEE